MLTIFSIPKPFTEGHVEVIQRQAIESWLHLRPACEVILCGDDAGVAEVAGELGTKHLPDMARNEFGTPLVSSAFECAQEEARFDLLCYVNADIILLDNFLPSIRRIPFEHFLMIGARWDLEITTRLDTRRPDYYGELRNFIAENGKRHPPLGSDYFVFRRGTLGGLPHFAVGRPGWDNWLIYHAARELRIPVIDASRSTMVVHQNHDYSHLRVDDYSKTWHGQEAEQNYALMGSVHRYFTLSDATYRLTNRWLMPIPQPLRRAFFWLRDSLFRLFWLAMRVLRFPFSRARKLYRLATNQGRSAPR